MGAGGSSAEGAESQKDTYFTCYRQPLFSIAVSVLDGITSNEDKVILTKLNSEYIYGVTALADEEVVDFDDDGKGDGNADVIPDDDGDDGDDKDNTEQRTEDTSKQSAEKAAERPITEKGSRKSRRTTTRPGSSVKASAQDIAPEIPLPDTVKTIAYMTKPEDFISVVLQVFETGLPLCLAWGRLSLWLSKTLYGLIEPILLAPPSKRSYMSTIGRSWLSAWRQQYNLLLSICGASTGIQSSFC